MKRPNSWQTMAAIAFHHIILCRLFTRFSFKWINPFHFKCDTNSFLRKRTFWIQHSIFWNCQILNNFFIVSVLILNSFLGAMSIFLSSSHSINGVVCKPYNIYLFLTPASNEWITTNSVISLHFFELSQTLPPYFHISNQKFSCTTNWLHFVYKHWYVILRETIRTWLIKLIKRYSAV